MGFAARAGRPRTGGGPSPSAPRGRAGSRSRRHRQGSLNGAVGEVSPRRRCPAAGRWRDGHDARCQGCRCSGGFELPFCYYPAGLCRPWFHRLVDLAPRRGEQHPGGRGDFRCIGNRIRGQRREHISHVATTVSTNPPWTAGARRVRADSSRSARSRSRVSLPGVASPSERCGPRRSNASCRAPRIRAAKSSAGFLAVVSASTLPGGLPLCSAGAGVSAAALPETCGDYPESATAVGQPPAINADPIPTATAKAPTRPTAPPVPMGWRHHSA